NRFLEATQLFERAVKLDAEAAPLHRALIPLYVALHRLDDALTACRKTLDGDPDDYETWYQYARLLKNQSRPKDAISALSRPVACPPLKELPELFVSMALDLATLSEDYQDYDRAMKALGTVIDVARQLENADEVQTKAIEAYVRICLKAKQYDRALAVCKTYATVLKTNDPLRVGRINYYMASICLERDKPEEALRYIGDYLKTQPPGTEPYELQIAILKKLKRSQEILPTLQEYASRDAHNRPLQLLLARQYAELGQPDQAQRHYLS